MNFNLVLKLRDPSGAQALVQAVSTPGSASFRHYLTAAQWEARFSPTAAQVAQAESWLTSEGFRVGAVSKDRLTIAASGTAAQVESAFGTTLANYRVAGHTVRQAKTNMSVPNSIAGIVAGAMGVNQSVATPALKAANPVSVVCDASQLNTWTPASLDGASGGYTSYTYPQPFYQAPVVPTALSERNSAGPVPARVVPDISLDADPGTGFLIGLTETFPGGAQKYGQTRYGGTSLASPILSGVIADADQAAGVAVGFINPDIYGMAGNASAITDLLPTGKQGNYRVDYANQLVTGVKGKATSFRELYFSGQETFCDATGNCASRTFPLTVTPGYDSLTGLGGIGPDFIADLANL